MTSNLKVPGVVKVFGLEEYEDGLMMVMEDIGGRSLDLIPESDPLPLVESLEIAMILAETLGSIHRQGIIHKNINPSHIIWNADTRQLNLIDFGIAGEAPERTVSPKPPSVPEGTLAYISPEQTGRINRPVDYRTDFYSLGVTVYQMLTMRLPFEAEDDPGMVHSHIAKTPLAPHELDADSPEMVSLIVMKLMAKMADERYQSGSGLKADLARCLRQLRMEGKIDSFSLGLEDFSDEMRIPRKLYGRQSEIDALLAAFGRVTDSGVSELVLLSGYSGVGKTSVVYEFRKALVAHRGLFAAGKFDQYKRDVPYATFVQAIQTLVRQILTKSESEIGTWRDTLKRAVSPNGQLIVDLVREVEIILGNQPPVPDLPPRESQNRFQMVLRQFLGVFATAEHPLVLFLDDLQWLDPATLDLIEHLATEQEIRHLLLIGAYRDNEVGPDHPLTGKLGSIREAGGTMVEISLTPLGSADVTQLVADSLKIDTGSAAPLAKLVHEKTAGNPFFTIQFLLSLDQQRLVAFDHGSGKWSWDLSRIHAKGFTDNMADLMAEKLTRLAPRHQRALQQFACLGNVAKTTTLSFVLGIPEKDVHGELAAAVLQGFIQEFDDAYGFAHDRVQEAAYSKIPMEARAESHLRIGRLLLRQTPQERRGEEVFEIVSQLNRGAALIDERAEREELAGLNLLAGNRAKSSTAYDAALAYFAAGAALLAKDRWERQHELAFALEINRAECEFLAGKHMDSEERLTKLSHRAADMPERALVACLQINLFTTLGQNSRAVAVGLDYLRHLGVTWQPHPTQDEARREYERIGELLEGRTIEDLLDLPLMNDPVSSGTLNVLVMMDPPARFTDTNLLTLVVCRTINLSIEHGNSDGSCSAYGSIGMIAGPNFGDYETGFRFAKLACSLVDHRGLKRFANAAHLVFACSAPWKQHIRTVIELLRDTFDTARRAGDLNYAGFCCNNLITSLLLAGDPLPAVQEEAERLLAFLHGIRFGLVIDLVTAQHALACTLSGRTQRFGSFDDETFSEPAFERHLSSRPELALAECWYWIRKLMARFMAGDHAEAMEAAARAEKLIWATMTFIEIADYHFFTALTHAACHDAADPEQRQQHSEALSAHLAQLETWARHCPENFENRAALVGAEIARIEVRPLDAERLYEAAIRSAQANGFVHNEALACELASAFHRRRGLGRIADAYLRDAYKGYACWGASGKVRQLERQHPWLMPSGSSEGESMTERLDAVSITKAQQAISSEMEMEKLLGKTMQIVVENAGAQRGFLFIEQDGEMQIVAKGGVDAAEVKIPLPARLDDSDLVAKSLVHFVARTKESIVLDDAVTEGEFISDPYIRREKTKSLLCAPLLSHGRLIGILYLENNMAVQAFTPARIQFLEMLLSQAAISLENARIYEALRESEEKYRRLVDSANEGIWVLDPDERITFVNARMAEMLGYSCEEVIGHLVTDFLFEEDVPDHFAKKENRRKGKSENYERRFRCKDEKILWTLVSATSIFNGHDFQGSFGMITDITERRQAEAEVERLKNYLADIIDSMPSMLVGMDNNDIITQWNRQVEAASGIPAAEAIGKPVQQLFPELASHIEKMAGEIKRHCPATLEKISIEEKGERRLYDLMLYPLLSNGMEGAVLRIEDVTERSRIQEMMIQNEKMMSLGGLAAGVAHEINNPLGTISQAAQNIERRVSPEIPANLTAAGELGVDIAVMKAYFEKRRIYDFIGNIRDASIRASRIIQNILRFSRSTEDILKPTSPASVLDQTLELAASDYDLKKRYDFRSIEIVRDDAPDIPEVPMITVEMEQVMLNLLRNAAQAMALNPPDRKPRITIRLRREDRYVLIEVEDNGPGMTEEVRRRVFEPFFTTKEAGAGTGLGLSVSYMIVTQNHKGLMEVQSTHKMGTCFRVRLPLV